MTISRQIAEATGLIGHQPGVDVGQTTRFGLAGIAPLVLLAIVHWLRDQHVSLGPIGNYLLGVLPNFCAALSITFVLISIWADQHTNADRAAMRRAFVGSAATSGIGLVAWEFFQRTSKNLVFDLNDLGATGFGLVAAAVIFSAISRSRVPL